MAELTGVLDLQWEHALFKGLAGSLWVLEGGALPVPGTWGLGLGPGACGLGVCAEPPKSGTIPPQRTDRAGAGRMASDVAALFARCEIADVPWGAAGGGACARFLLLFLVLSPDAAGGDPGVGGPPVAICCSIRAAHFQG